MSDVDFERNGSIATITINRPERMNAINASVVDLLYDAWVEFEADEALTVAILTGKGKKAFCAGMDLKEAASTGSGLGGRKLPVLGDNVVVTKPVIAAVNGAALAGGWLFAQMCDLCVAADNATFGITEAKWGRGVPWAAPLVSMIPSRIALELMLTGDTITAQRAYEIGFVNRVVAAEDLEAAAVDLALRIAGNAPLSVRASKELVHIAAEMGRSAALRVAAHLFEKVYRSDDAREGPRAFAEKRHPGWTGR